MQNNLFDIAVIGGGLAGLSLAIQGASKGYRTVLFEKETYPFHKVCGEYISLESKPFLEKLGVPLQQMQLPIIDHLKISDCTGHLYNFTLPLGGFGISRFYLDDLLYKIAIERGVTVLCKTKVNDTSFVDDQFVINSPAGTITSTVVAACYGKKSNIDVKLNRPFLRQKANRLNNYIGVKYHVKHEHSSNAIALHNFKNGYCGISKIEDGKSCLCYLTTETNLQRNGNSINEMEKNVLFKNPLLNEIFNKAEFLFSKPVTISKVSFNKKQQVEDHLLMVGDSAGMITPLCGNGMSMALHAGKIAFSCINLFLAKRIGRAEMENIYTKNWKQQFATRLLTGRMVQRVFGGNTSTALFLKSMNQVPFLARLVIRSTHGDVF